MDDLALLEARVRQDLEWVGYPARNWVPSRPTQAGVGSCGVLVVGAGLCGQTAAFALKRLGIGNIRVVDQAASGREGPWVTYARMPTLRTRKDLNGPDLGIPSLTYRAWHQAGFGVHSWEQLGRIPRHDWMDYLVWVRRMTGIEVTSEVSLQEIRPVRDGVVVTLADREGNRSMLHARKVVLATGREGSGGPKLPRFPSFDVRRRAGQPVYHSTDDIDFGILRGANVAVLGTGASAFDNAGCALEAGAASVVMFGRAPHLPKFKKNTWASFDGVKLGHFYLDPERRQELHGLLLGSPTPAPEESVARCSRHPNFRLRSGCPWQDLRVDESGVRVILEEEEAVFDAAVLATGFNIALEEVPYLRTIADEILRWRHVQSASHQGGAGGDYPYLGPAFELAPLHAESAHIRHVHLFNAAVAMSHGALGSEIPGLQAGATRLAQGIASSLFVDDAKTHLEAARRYEEPVLQEWHAGRDMGLSESL